MRLDCWDNSMWLSSCQAQEKVWGPILPLRGLNAQFMLISHSKEDKQNNKKWDAHKKVLKKTQHQTITLNST